MEYYAGVSARGDGEEEEDAAEVQGHRVVDEEAATAISHEAKGLPLRTPEVGSPRGRRRDGTHQGSPRRPPEGHQALYLPRPYKEGHAFIITDIVVNSTCL